MTDQERSSEIAQLKIRLDKFEEKFYKKLDEIQNTLTAIQIAGAKACPAPGKCLSLEAEISQLREITKNHDRAFEDLVKTVATLMRWRAWLTGAILVISTITLAVLGATAQYIVKHL